MGFGDTFKKFAAAINPVTAFSTAAAIGGDYLAAKQAGKDADSARESSERNAQLDRDMQREFAQHGIRWRVEDAKAAGLHPLAALGSSGASYTPSSYTVMPDNSKADFYSRTGQNIARAIDATRTSREREEALFDEQLRGARLQNDLLSIQVHRAANPPMASDSELQGFLLPGQSGSRPTAGAQPLRLDEVPLRRTVSHPDRPYQDPAHVADYAYVRTPTGLSIVPSKDVKERIEDQLIPELAWAYRNMWKPNFKGFPKPSTRMYPLTPRLRKLGYRSWQWSYWSQEFVPSKKPE